MSPKFSELKTILILLAGFTMSAFGTVDLPENYYHDDEVTAARENTLTEAPKDPIIIKRSSLRIGICGLIDAGRLNLEQGILIWEQERAPGVIQRAKEDIQNKNEFTL